MIEHGSKPTINSLINHIVNGLKSNVESRSTGVIQDVSPIDDSLEKYHYAQKYYANHPNLAMRNSYDKSVAACLRLKQAFERSAEISQNLTKAKSRSLAKSEREDRVTLLIQNKIFVLEEIHNARTQLTQLKQERVTLRKNNPH